MKILTNLHLIMYLFYRHGRLRRAFVFASRVAVSSLGMACGGRCVLGDQESLVGGKRRNVDSEFVT